MDRQHLILEELGLLPLWVRRDVLADIAAKEQAAHESFVATHPAREVLESVHQPLPPQAAIVSATPAHTHHMNEVLAVAKGQRKDGVAESAIAGTPLRGDVAGMDWAALESAVSSCQACGLCKGRQNTVFGVGNRAAEWMVVGEAPGAEEDRMGEPFVGRAGKLLDAMLASVARSRQQNVFIANVLKCRPPNNRNPEVQEMAQCQGYLHRQIELVKPKVIFAVGRFAVQSMLASEATIASLRGRVHDFRGTPVIVSYHPAYLLRNPLDKIKAWEDLLLARKILESR